MVITFGKNFKGLVLVGDPYLLTNKNISKVPQDCVPCTYYPIFFWKIKKGFGFWPTRSQVSISTPMDISKLGFMVWSTNIRTHQIDSFILQNKNGWWECSDISQALRFLGRKIARMRKKFGKTNILLSENFCILFRQ